jgi:hypothetical protein
VRRTQRPGGLLAQPLLVIGDPHDLPAFEELLGPAGHGPRLKLELLAKQSGREGEAEIVGIKHDRHLARPAPLRPPEQDVVDVGFARFFFLGGLFGGGSVQGIGTGGPSALLPRAKRLLLFLVEHQLF